MNVQQFLENHHSDFRVIPHRRTYDSQHLAQELHVPGSEVAKTVLLRANGGYRYFVAVLPATRHVDMGLVSKGLGGSEVQLATEEDLAQHCPDCELGVLPPFGSLYNMVTLVDESLARDEEIVFEGNRHDEAIRMKFETYRKLEEPLVLDFAR